MQIVASQNHNEHNEGHKQKGYVKRKGQGPARFLAVVWNGGKC
jgi:hypothetical protein